MISFKNFLIESRSAPLYHATSTKKAISIVDMDELRRASHPEDNIGKRTVSLTRNFTFARNWLHGFGTGVIFELDQRKLSQRYKMVPYNYFADRHARLTPRAGQGYTRKRDYEFENQFEEAVLHDIKPVTKYISKVFVVRNKSLEITEDDMVEELKQKGIKVEYIT